MSEEFAVRFNPLGLGQIAGPFPTHEAANDWAAAHPKKGQSYRILMFSDGLLVTEPEEQT